MVLPHRQRAYLYWGVRKELKNSRTQKSKQKKPSEFNAEAPSRGGAENRRHTLSGSCFWIRGYLSTWVLEYSSQVMMLIQLTIFKSKTAVVLSSSHTRDDG